MEPDIDERKRRFTQLYDRHYASVYAFAARRVGRDHADEIAAETFLIAWRRFDLLSARPLAWLYGVARNVIARRHAAQTREGQIIDAVTNELTVRAAHLDLAGDDTQLADAWERLAAGDREVLALVAWEELSVAEAAAVLGCSAPAFSVRLHRARGRLSRLLAAGGHTAASKLSEVGS